MDALRRARGVLLDAAALGPQQTPSRIIHAEPGLRVRAYNHGTGNGAAILLVPAPIKGHYIWDLAPDISVVRALSKRGMRVYLAQWLSMDQASLTFGLEDYASRLLGAAIDAVDADRGADAGPLVLAGHSLGGTLATIQACLHPARLKAVVLVESPLHFPPEEGKLASMVSAAGDSAALTQGCDFIPGSFLNMVSSMAAPEAFQSGRYVDWMASAGNLRSMVSHMRVERWMLDELPMPVPLFRDVLDHLYRGDSFMQGMLQIGGRRIGPADLQVPLLSVFDPRSEVIPPESIIPFHDAAVGAPKKLIAYEGDVGVAIQHVGALVGKNAHERLWPAIGGWLDALDRPDSCAQKPQYNRA